MLHACVFILHIATARPHSRAAQLQGEVLSHHEPTLEYDDEIELKLHAEGAGNGGRACEQAREYEVDGDGHIAWHISIADLEVLDLRGCGTTAVRAVAGRAQTMLSRTFPRKLAGIC